MPIVLIPVHFDRDPIDHIPSCQRSVVIRTFITSDFMTGVPATPGKQIPIEVRISLSHFIESLQNRLKFLAIKASRSRREESAWIIFFASLLSRVTRLLHSPLACLRTPVERMVFWLF